jgi:hypothetical protein
MIGALVCMIYNNSIVSAAFLAEIHMPSWQSLHKNDKRKLTSRREPMSEKRKKEKEKEKQLLNILNTNHL